MPPVVTSVHSRVTSSELTTSMTYREYRTQHMVDEVSSTEDFYKAIDDLKFKSYLEDFQKCCTGAWFVRDSTDGLVKTISHRCKLRWCPICSKTKAYKISKALEEKLRPTSELRLLTLTLKHNETNLTAASNRLYSCFQRLRKTSKFKKFVSGGVWFYQLTWNMDTLTWHPHIHCVITGKYFKQSEIKKLWQKITGDSYVVDIRYASRKGKVLAYVSRYVSRPVSLRDCPPYEYVNIFNAFKSRKLCGSWGVLRGVDLRGSKSLMERELTKVGSWTTVWAMSKDDGNAMLILEAWRNQTPLHPGVNCLVYDNLIDDIKPINVRAGPDPMLF